MDRLAADNEHSFVKLNVASNPNTSSDTLERLAEAHAQPVRVSVADNPNTPIEALELLAEDEDKVVRNSAIQNLRRH